MMRSHGMRGSRRMSAYVEDQKERGRKTDAHTLRRIMQSFVPYKVQIFLVVFAILLTTGLGLVNPLMIRDIFDNGISKRDLQRLAIDVAIMVVTPVVTGLIGVWQTYLNNVIGQSVMRDFRNRLYTHLQSMSLRFFTGTRTGEIQSRLSNDVNGIEDVVTDTASGIVANVSIVISTIIAMLILSPLLTLISLCMLPLFLWITVKVGEVRRQTSKETQKSMAALTAMMQETLSVSGILLMKTFGRQKYAQRLFDRENLNLTALEIRKQMIGRWFFMTINIFFSIIPAVIYLVAGWQIIAGDRFLTLGLIVAFTTLQTRIFFPIGQLLQVQVEIQGALALFDRIFEYLDMPIDIQDAPNALVLKPEQVEGRVEFKDVSFTYQRDNSAGMVSSIPVEGADAAPERLKLPFLPRRATSPEKEVVTSPVEKASPSEEELRPTLNHVSFEILPGQLAALVGPSGAGKTTITYMVPRLYDVDSGSVEIDGYSVKDVTLNTLSELIGVVTQETYLFHASVRENLFYARENATEEEMIAAAKAAAIHDRIMDLDEGYDTVVGERGYKLSGGEKQRIAIARVILKNPRVLILDEATSALDTHSERLIQAALEPLMKDRTTLAIAHRLSTILSADVILVVNKGEIVERGTHHELLALGGVYSRLYREQFEQLSSDEQEIVA